MATQPLQPMLYYSPRGYCTALVRPGRTRLLVVLIDGHVRAYRLPMHHLDYMIPLGSSVAHVKRTYRRAGRILGITKTAARLCRGS